MTTDHMGYCAARQVCWKDFPDILQTFRECAVIDLKGGIWGKVWEYGGTNRYHCRETFNLTSDKVRYIKKQIRV